MVFADDLVICEHSRAEVEIQLEIWRETFESHGLRVSRGKTEYMPCPESDQTIYIQDKEVKTVKTFKYLGSMFDANGGAEKDVNNRVKIAWSKWTETTGVMCDRNIPTKLKDNVYKTAIKPAMVTEMRMLRWARGKTRLDHVRNVDIWNEAHMYPMAEFLREKRLRWFGHVQRRDKDDATRKILQMEVEGKRNRGTPKLRWRDLVKDDMARNQMTTEMAEDRRHWHVLIRAGTLRRVEADR